MATKWTVTSDGRRYLWKSWLHPRDRHGLFIETFAEVRTLAGMLGRVVGRGRRANTVRVRRHKDKKEFDVPQAYLTVLRRPGGQKPTREKGPDVREMDTRRPKKLPARRGLKGAQDNDTLETWDSDGLSNHLATMFRDNGDDLDDRYALGVARWKLYKDGRDTNDASLIDTVIDDAREAAGLDRTPGDDEITRLMEQDDIDITEPVEKDRLPDPVIPSTIREARTDVWEAETGQPFRAQAWHRTDKERADIIRSEGFDPNADAATDQIFGNAIYLGVNDESSLRGEQNLQTLEGYEEKIDAYVSLRNPLVIEGVENYGDDEVMWGDTIDVLVAESLGIPTYELNQRVTGNRDKPPKRGQLRQYLVREGYDGIVYRERDYSGMGGSQIIVFDDDAVSTDEEMLPDAGGDFTEGARITPVRVANMPPKVQKRIQNYVDKYAIDTQAIEDEFYEAIQNEEYRKFGESWYRQEMHAAAERIAEATKGMKHELSVADALTLLAIFSARNEWESPKGNRWNEINARQIAVAWASGAFDGLTGQQIMDRSDPDLTDPSDPDYWEFPYIRDAGFGLSGARYLTGEMTRGQALGKAKRKSFYSNGLEPETNTDVTVDVWMANPLARHSNLRKIKKWQDLLSPGDPPKYLTDIGVDAGPLYVLMSEIVRRAHERGVADGLWDADSVPSYTQAAAWLQQKIKDREGI